MVHSVEPETVACDDIAVRFEPFPEAALGVSICDRFQKVARRFASRLAVSDAARSLTYAELQTLAGQLTCAIRMVSTGRSGPVAILLRHEARYSAALLGALAAGRGCVPLDADHPLERNRIIAAHAGAAAVVAAGDLALRARELFASEIPIIDLDLPLPSVERADGQAPGLDDLACIIYTSGSTGTPKGVYQNHRGVLHDIRQGVNTVRMEPADRLALVYSPSVIAGLRTTFSALLTGASLRVLSPTKLGPTGLAREIREHGLTILSSSPALFRYTVETLGSEQRFDTLRVVSLGGDRVDWADVDVFKRGCVSTASLLVHLGATECWTLYAQWFVDDSLRSSGARLPVGRVVGDRIVTLVDAAGAPVADGEIGECIVGRHVALGYWHNEELTRQAFGTDTRDPSIRIYRTGDLVRQRSDGLLEHFGRKDQQIKLAGRRVEPGEIEVALKACSGIKDAAVIVRSRDQVAQSLSAFVELQPQVHGLLAHHVKAMIGQRVPRHMVPARLTVLDELPRLPTFKIDRNRLAQMNENQQGSSRQEPEHPWTTSVVRVFEETLGVTNVTPDDNFASLGGDSLQAARIVAKLQDRFGLKIPLDSFETAESIGQFVRWMAQSQSGASPATAAKVRARTPRHTRIVPGYVADTARRGARALVRWASRRDMTRRVFRRHLLVWATTVDYLASIGDLEAATEEARCMHAAHPDMPYARNLSEILNRMPPLNDSRPAFRDDPSQELQICPLDNAEAVVFLFCGWRQGLGMPLPVCHRWFSHLPATLVYLRDFRREYYFAGLRRFGDDLAASTAGLRELARQLRAPRIFCWGNSAGAAAALKYGLELEAERVVAFDGPFEFGREFNAHLRSARLAARLRQKHAEELLNIRHLYSSAERRPQCLVAYGDGSWDDRLHAESLSGLPGMHLLCIENHPHHNVVTSVVRRGWLEQVLAWLMTASPLPHTIPDPVAKQVARRA